MITTKQIPVSTSRGTFQPIDLRIQTMDELILITKLFGAINGRILDGIEVEIDMENLYNTYLELFNEVGEENYVGRSNFEITTYKGEACE